MPQRSEEACLLSGREYALTRGGLPAHGLGREKSAEAIVFNSNELTEKIIKRQKVSQVEEGLNFKTLKILSGCTLLKSMQAHRKHNTGTS